MAAGLILHTLGHAAAERARDTWRSATRHPRKLRIGIDIRPFYEPLTGIGWYLYHLLHELAKHEDVELYLFGDARVTDFGPTLHAETPANARLCWFDLRGQGIISGRSRATTAAASPSPARSSRANISGCASTRSRHSARAARRTARWSWSAASAGNQKRSSRACARPAFITSTTFRRRSWHRSTATRSCSSFRRS